MTKKRARLTESAERIAEGALCRCEACLRDGQHEPDCPVHDEQPGPCRCGREDSSKGAG